MKDHELHKSGEPPQYGKNPTLYVCLFSILAHLMVLMLFRAHWERVVFFRTELFFFLFLSTACSIALMFPLPIRVWIGCIVARIASVFVIIRILNPESAQAELLMLVPLFFEIAFYLDTRWSAGLNIALVLAVAFANSVSWPLDTPRLPATDILPRMLLEAGAVVTAAVLIRYRETILDYQRQLANLHNAVANLSTANHAFQVYADSMEFRSAEKERNRITRELHDSVGYALTNIIMMMSAGKVLYREDESKLPELFEEARRQADDALTENRRILYRLREIQDLPEGLLKIRHLAKVFSEATGIEIETSFGNLPLTISDRIDSMLYRVVQEGLTNAFRHGKATKIAISFWNDEKELRVSLRDNGLGAEVIQEGIGLKGMKERLEDFGGTLRAYNVPDGFNLGVSIPRMNLGQMEKGKA